MTVPQSSLPDKYEDYSCFTWLYRGNQKATLLESKITEGVILFQLERWDLTLDIQVTLILVGAFILFQICKDLTRFGKWIYKSAWAEVNPLIAEEIRGISSCAVSELMHYITKVMSTEMVSYIKTISNDISKLKEPQDFREDEWTTLEAIKVLLMHRKMLPSDFSMVTINLLAREDFFTKNRLILPMTTSYVKPHYEGTKPDEISTWYTSNMCKFAR